MPPSRVTLVKVCLVLGSDINSSCWIQLKGKGGVSGSYLVQVRDLKVINQKCNWILKTCRATSKNRGNFFFLKNQKLPDFQGITDLFLISSYSFLPIALITRCFSQMTPPPVIYLEPLAERSSFVSVKEMYNLVSRRKMIQSPGINMFRGTSACQSPFLLSVQGCAFKADDRLCDESRLYEAAEIWQTHFI